MLGEPANGIPVVAGLDAAMAVGDERAEWFVIGMAPLQRPAVARRSATVVLRAMSLGMSVVNGLHEFLNDDPEFVAAAILAGVEIVDIRRPPDKKDLLDVQRSHRVR